MKQTFCLARATLLLLVMLCSIGAWAQTYTVTLEAGDGSGANVTLNSTDDFYNTTTNWSDVPNGKFYMEGDKLWFKFPDCPVTFTAPGDGRIFIGWKINDGDPLSAGTYYPISADLTLTAVWDNLEFDEGVITDEGKGDFTFRVTGSSSYEVQLKKCTFLSINDLTIPATVEHGGINYSVTSIGEEAFIGCTNLTSVTIPASVTSIGKEAFIGCTNLTSVTIPNSMSFIGQSAFEYCGNLASVYVMATTPPTFGGCCAFDDNASGRKIYVPANSIGDSSTNGTYKYDWSDYESDIEAFPNGSCGNGVTWEFNGAVLTISGTGAMADYTDANYQPWAANRLVIKTIVINEGVTSIGKYAFSNCESVTSGVSIPASVTSIGNYSFNYCSMTSLTIPSNSSLETIGSFAFNCAGFGSVTIPASVKSIGNNAFDGSAALTTVTLNSNPFIGESAFYSSTAVTMNLTANGPVDGAYWATFYNKNYSFEADANTQVFKAELVGTKITLHEVANRVVDAGEGVVLKTIGGGNPEMTLTTSASGDSQNNSLAGVSAPAGVTADGTTYVLNNGSNGVGFYKLTAGKTLGVGKAYLTYSGTTAPGFFGLDVDNENTTAINEHELNESHELSGAWYDLQGRKIANGQKPTAKGLYIVNGKKVMIK